MNLTFFFLLIQLPGKLNEIDTEGRLPLDLALQQCLEGIAQTLVKHKVDVNRKDRSGLCLLHQAIKRGNSNALNEALATCNAISDLPHHIDGSFHMNSTKQGQHGIDPLRFYLNLLMPNL